MGILEVPRLCPMCGKEHRSGCSMFQELSRLREVVEAARACKDARNNALRAPGGSAKAWADLTAALDALESK